MKDRGDMTSVGNGSALPPSFPDHHHPNSVSQPPPPRAHHDHRHNRRAGGGEKEPWQRMPTLGVDINLLANSLSSRLRKAARHKASPTSTTPTTPTTTTTATTTTNTSSHSSRSGAPEESRKKHSKAFDSKRDLQPPPQAGTVPQSILKRTLPKEMVDQQFQHMLLEHRGGGSASSQDFHLHLPDVFMTRRWSSSPGQLDFLDDDPEGFNNQILDRPCPTVNVFSGKAGGGGGGGGGWFPSRTHTSNGHVVWIKRSGVFLPADKYAQGRQNLHGDDQPYGRTQPVDYETVTLPSRAHTPDSDSDVLSSGWSSGKGLRKKGLKVSWKQPSESYEGQEAEDPRPTDTALSSRQRSAGTVHSEPGSYRFVKPRFNPGKSRVPVVGVKWKVPTPTVGKPPGEGGVREEEVHTPSSGDLSGRSTPTSTVSLPAAPPRIGGSPSKPSSHHDPRHPWRAMYPRDVHPVTTGLEREGTSVSKTMWQVPSLRPVPAFTFIEDLMEGAGRHWQPNPHTHRLATRATLDGQSYQNRLKEAAASSKSNKDTTVSSTNTLSNASDPES